MHHPEKYWKVFIKWGLLGLVMGLIGGVLAAVEGEAYLYDFALKLLFTAVTLSAGFKGGEIVPTFFCIRSYLLLHSGRPSGA